MRYIITLILLIFAATANAAAISTFPWSQSFDCAEYTPTAYNSWTPPTGCTDINAHNYISLSGYQTTITSSANHTPSGGNGLRFWDGAGFNSETTVLSVDFDSPQKEVWFRWYQRYESGYSWADQAYNKLLYIHAGASSTGTYIGGFSIGGGSEIHNQAVLWIMDSAYRYVNSSSTYNWNHVFGSNDGTSDGRWVYIELHMLMDTDTTDGEGHIYIDGVLAGSDTSVNWSSGNATLQNGFVHLAFDANQNSPDGTYYVDYDDLAVSTTGYIGPIVANGSAWSFRSGTTIYGTAAE